MTNSIQNLANLIQGGNIVKGKQILVNLNDSIESIQELGIFSSSGKNISNAGTRIINYLFIRYLTYQNQEVHAFFEYIGCIVEKNEEDIKYNKFVIAPLFDLITNPVTWLENEFGWTTHYFDVDKFLFRLKRLVELDRKSHHSNSQRFF